MTRDVVETVAVRSDEANMHHDEIFRKSQGAEGSTERREHDRLAFPAELIVVWHHDPESTTRYRVIDASDGGFRIASTMPVLEGSTGTSRRLLPESTVHSRPVIVVWCRELDEGDGYEIGLRLF